MADSTGRVSIGCGGVRKSQDAVTLGLLFLWMGGQLFWAGPLMLLTFFLLGAKNMAGPVDYRTFSIW